MDNLKVVHLDDIMWAALHDERLGGYSSIYTCIVATAGRIDQTHFPGVEHQAEHRESGRGGA